MRGVKTIKPPLLPELAGQASRKSNPLRHQWSTWTYVSFQKRSRRGGHFFFLRDLPHCVMCIKGRVELLPSGGLRSKSFWIEWAEHSTSKPLQRMTRTLKNASYLHFYHRCSCRPLESEIDDGGSIWLDLSRRRHFYRRLVEPWDRWISSATFDES